MTDHARDRYRIESGSQVRLPEPIPTDVVFDFTGIERMDVCNLSLLLTAGRLAHADDRNVWIAAVPDQAWYVLHSLGLEEFFLAFPGDEGTAV